MRGLKFSGLLAIVALFLNSANADRGEDPLLWKVQVDELEVCQDGGENAINWDGEVWYGKDLHKLVMKFKGERASGETEEIELQLLYSYAISPYWDLQFGWRSDIKPEPDRDWLILAVEGLAPYFIETEITLFFSEDSDFALRLEAEYEWNLSDRSALVPSLEINFHSFNDEVTGIGSGLSNFELGVRWHYALTRQLLPYVGVNWEKTFGETASQTSEEGEKTDSVVALAGVGFWF